MSTDWEHVFTSLGETALFEVIRHYLGPVSTPYHRPELIRSLTAFLDRKDILQQSIIYIDETDAIILSCIDISIGPSQSVLTDIIPNMEKLILQEHLLNLEERLLIWQSSCSRREKEYQLTPLGEKIRDAGYIGPGAILGKPLEGLLAKTEPWFNENFLNSTLNFLLESQPILRINRSWQKKAIKKLKCRFPALFYDGKGEERLFITGNALIKADLAFFVDERINGKFEPNLKLWRKLESYSHSDRRIIMISCAIAKHRIGPKTASRVVSALTGHLPLGKAYEAEKIISLIRIYASNQYRISPQSAGRILSDLVLLGELVPGELGGYGRPEPLREPENNALKITPSGDIICHPGFPLSYTLSVAVNEMIYDTVTRCRLEKERFIDGMEADIDPQSLIQVIEQHSGHPAPANIVTMIREWEKEYNALSFQFALILKARGRQCDIIEETKTLKKHAIDHPARGFWILDFTERDAWIQTLARLGITRIPRIRGLTECVNTMVAETMDTVKFERARHYNPWHGMTDRNFHISTHWQTPNYSDPVTVLHELSRHPDVESLNSTEKSIFHERLERRLILSSEQIRSGAWYHGVMKATGLDHQAKLNLIEATLGRRNEQLEISVTDGDAVKTVTLVPQTLMKQRSKHILIGHTIHDGIPVECMVNKMSHLRRIKISLF